MPGHFRFLDDIALADAAFEAIGDSPSDVATAAALAVIETMVDPQTVAEQWHRTITRQDTTLDDLIFDWLSDLVYIKNAEGMIFRDATALIQHEPAGLWNLRGTLIGEPIDPSRHELRADVKAVTKHRYEISHDGAHWLARVVLDI